MHHFGVGSRDYTDIPAGEPCPDCGYTDGHNVKHCPRVLDGRAKAIPGLSPESR